MQCDLLNPTCIRRHICFGHDIFLSLSHLKFATDPEINTCNAEEMQ